MFCGKNTTAQVLTVTDTSDAHAMRIKSTINANREIVDFIEHSLAQRKLPKHLRNLPLWNRDSTEQEFLLQVL